MKDANNQRFTPFGIFSRSIGLAPDNMKKEEEQNSKHTNCPMIMVIS